MKNLRNKGISLISLTVAVCILIVISSMLIYNAKSGVNIRKLKMMQNDIATLDDAINSYYAKYGALPVKIEYNVMPLPFFNDISPNDNEVYYVIDLTALEGITLNYGVEYQYINTQEDLLDNEDVYVINEQSHRIYYARGIEMDGVVYYTNDKDEDVELHQRQWSQAVTFYQEQTYGIDTFGELYIFDFSYTGTIKENTNYVKANDLWKDASILQGKNIIQVSAGQYHTTALDEEGKVYTWGQNGSGELGNGTAIDSKIPICISDIQGMVLQGKKITQVTAGENDTVAIDENGKVYAWGFNAVLIDGNSRTSYEPVCISDISGHILQGKEIIQIKPGEFHTVAIDKNGKVYAWGNNRWGQLGNGTTSTVDEQICLSDISGNVLNGKKIVEISTSGSNTIALDEEGKVYTWGGNLGNGTTTDNFNPVCISDISGNALNGKKIIQISAESSYAMVLDEEGKVYTWGNNDSGRLGDGITEVGYREYRRTPLCISDITGNSLQGKKIVEIFAGSYHAMALDEEGNVYTWGSNENGKLGDGITEIDYSGYRDTPMCISNISGHVLGGKKIKQISAGLGHTVTLDEEGKIYIWGANIYGQLGNGTEATFYLPISINTAVDNEIQGKKIVKISSAGNGWMVALDSEGKVYTWGNNRRGQLGNGTTVGSSVPRCISDISGSALNRKKIVEISVGDYHTIALDEEGNVYTWGENADGQLGDSTTTNSSIPICISDINGNILRNLEIIQVTAGRDYTVVIDSNRKVYTWGNNRYGQLGNGTTEDSSTPICISDITGNIFPENKIIKVSAGESHTIALDEDGKVYVWGSNSWGQLGIDTGTNNYKPICISEISGSALNKKKIVQISAGDIHSIVLDENGKVYAWGYNDGIFVNEYYSGVPICVNDIAGSTLEGRSIEKIESEILYCVIIDDKGWLTIFGFWTMG